MILTPSREFESQDEDEPQEEDAEDLEDAEFEYLETGDILVTRRVLSTAHVSDEIAQRENIFHTRCTNVFPEEIPAWLPPQRGIERQFEHFLGAQSFANSLPLIQFKEEPPDFVRKTLTFNLYNSGIAGLHLIVDIEGLDRLGVLTSGLDMSLLPKKLDLGTRAYPLVRVDSDTLLSALMLATSLYCFAGADRVYRDDQWVKEKPPDVVLKLHEELCTTSLRLEVRYFESNILFLNVFRSMNIGLNDIAYIEEPIKLGVMSSCLDLALFLDELHLGVRSCVMVHTHCQVSLSIMMHLLLAQKAYCFAGARKEFRFDQWTKEKPPDSSLWLLGEGTRDERTYGSKPRGKVDTTLDFNEIDSGFAFAGSVYVLRSKPLEEGGNDRDLNLMLVPELVPDKQLVAEQLGSQGTQRIVCCLYVDCLGVSFAGLSTLSLKGVWTLFSQEGEELAPPTLH